MNSLRFSAHHFELKRCAIAGSHNQPCTFLAENFRREVRGAHCHPDTSFTARDATNEIFAVFIGATLTTNARQRKRLRTLRDVMTHDVLHKCIVVNFAHRVSLHQ
jgi:hypothetical protein